MQTLFGEVKENKYDEKFIKGDSIDGLNSDPELGKSPRAQKNRVEEYVEITQFNCERAEAVGVPKIIFGRISLVEQRELKLKNLKYLNLDREYKIMLFDKLSELVINGNKASLFFPKNGDSFDVGISW